MTERTPTTREVRDAYKLRGSVHDIPETAEEFDRWLADYSAQVRSDAADMIRTYWESNGELIDTHNGARLAFEAVVADLEGLTS